MESIDQRIKKELEHDQLEHGDNEDFLDDFLSVTAMDSFESNWKATFKYVFVIGIIFFGLMVWCIYQFVTAADIAGKIDWGVWSILAGLLGVIMELWAWIQISRLATRRELKQLEGSILRAVNSSNKDR